MYLTALLNRRVSRVHLNVGITNQDFTTVTSAILGVVKPQDLMKTFRKANYYSGFDFDILSSLDVDTIIKRLIILSTTIIIITLSFTLWMSEIVQFQNDFNQIIWLKLNNSLNRAIFYSPFLDKLTITYSFQNVFVPKWIA